MCLADQEDNTGATVGWEKEMATHSSVPVWETRWTEGAGRVQSTGSRRVGHSSVQSLSRV